MSRAMDFIVMSKKDQNCNDKILRAMVKILMDNWIFHLCQTKNLFLSLDESIAQTLNVTLCYVCQGNQHGRPLGLYVMMLQKYKPLN
jgi:hypothetical protein